ncbi:MAG: glycosyltransferase [Aquificae bacterium]|nr:glycosyltransferase [Aquificota bacterium]
MKAKWEISSRDEFKRDYLSTAFFVVLWVGISLVILLSLPERAWSIKLQGLVAIAFIGIWRYSWFMLNVVNALVFKYLKFPEIKKKAFSVDNPYPKRLYFMIPSYKEAFEVSAQVFKALAIEVYKIPSEVYVYVSVGSEEEAHFIESVVRANDPARRINLVFLKQEMGKRVAMGHTLRAIARHFNNPLNWHPDYRNDIVVFMDGDTVMGRNSLLKTLPYFRAFPRLGALTTDEGINYIGRSKWIYLWYKLKFAKRHLMMMSHSLHWKVLTLTGRWSAFRANIVLSEEFIRYVEADHIDHYLFGRFRFLMGDDKSTWFYLLKEGWDMLYIPDAIVWSTEDRTGNFFKITGSLMFRWYGNMLRNNWRAIKLGPYRIGSWFIWWALVDQRISMWTTLVGPTGATLLSLFVSPFYWVFYLVWAIWVRVIQILILDLVTKLNPHPVHLLQHLYDQWVGSIIKIYASSNLAKQKWAKKASQVLEAQVPSLRTARAVFRYFLMFFYFSLFVFFVGIYVGVFKLPSLPHLIGFAHGAQADCLPQRYGIFPADGKDDSEGLNRLLSECSKVELPEGRYLIEKPIVISKSGTVLEGKGKVVLVSKIKGRGKAVILIKGNRGKLVGKTFKPSPEGSEEVYARLTAKPPFIFLRKENTEEFLKSIGSKVWFRKYPAVRRGIYRVKEVEENKILLFDKLDIDYPAGTQVWIPQMIEGVVVRNLTVIQETDGNPKETKFVYENLFPDYRVDGIRVEWGSFVRIENVRVIMAGRHPLALENSYGIYVSGLEVNGSWNKGAGGNGYVRVSGTRKSLVENCKIKGIRHFTFQWASSENLLRNCYLEVDINFHGGYTRFNEVREVHISIPPEHPWAPVEKTPRNARWAPPDGKGNRVLNATLEFK